MTADYYVLRLYRRQDSHADEVLGTLEETASGNSWAFKNDAELRRVIEEVAHPDRVENRSDSG